MLFFKSIFMLVFSILFVFGANNVKNYCSKIVYEQAVQFGDSNNDIDDGNDTEKKEKSVDDSDEKVLVPFKAVNNEMFQSLTNTKLNIRYLIAAELGFIGSIFIPPPNL